MATKWKSIGGLIGRRKSSFAIAKGKRGYKITKKFAALIEKSPTVSRCIQIVSEAIGSLPLEVEPLSESSEHREAADRARRLLAKPNPWQLQDEFIESLVSEKLSFGNVFIRTPRNGGGDIVAMGPLETVDVSVEALANGEPRYRVAGISGNGLLSALTGKGTLTPSDILHIRDGGTPELLTMPRIAPLELRVRALIAADMMIMDTFEGGPNVNLFVSAALGSDQEELEALKEMLETALSGKGARALVATDATVTELSGLKPADTDLRELRADLIREICGQFGVPPFLVGGQSDTKYNNVTARLTALNRDVVFLVVQRVSRALTYATNAKVSMDVSALLAGDLLSQAKVATTLAGRPVLSGNEARALIGYDPSDDEGMDKIMEKGPAGGGDTGDRRGEQPTDDGVAVPEDERLDS